MIASASRNLFSMMTSLPRSICWISPDSSSPTLSANSSRIRARSPSRTRWMIRCLAACTAEPAEGGEGDVLLEHVARLELGILEARLLERHLAGRVLDGLDHLRGAG